MRAITVRQPWALAIVSGAKPVENRSRNIAGAYRGPILIHSGAAIDRAAFDDPVLGPWLNRTWFIDRDGLVDSVSPVRMVIGVADLVDVHTDGTCYDQSIRELAALHYEGRLLDAIASHPDNGMGGIIGRARYCSPWALPDHHHLMLANARRFHTPIPAKGKLGLWTPDADLLAAVREQMAETVGA